MKRQQASATTTNPSAVWMRWTRPELWPEHNSDLVSAALEGPLQPGGRITMRPKKGPASKVLISAVDAQRQFTTEGRMPGCRLEIDHQMSGDGAESSFTHTFTMSGPATPIFWALFGRRLAGQLPGMVAKIAELSESDDR